MGIKAAIVAVAMGLGGLSASAEPAGSSLPGGDDLPASLERPSLAVVVCLEADPFFDPAEAFPYERVITCCRRLSRGPEGVLCRL